MAAADVGTNKFGLDAELFTRGTGENNNRGEALVQRHLEKLQQDKENLAMQKLEALMPQMGAAVRVLALKECVFDVETAINLLRSFQSANDDVLKGVHKKRKKLKAEEAAAVQAAEEEAARAAQGSGESGSSSSSEDSGSDSGSDSDRGRKRRRKDKERRSSSRGKGRSSKKKKKRSSKDKDKEKERSKKKRSKADPEKAKPKSLTASENFGRFGILRETDANAKRSEFVLWATEVKKVDVELLGRTEERELFRDYMEDFNTGTLPHRKYYNVEIYAREKAVKAAAKGAKRAAAVSAAAKAGGAVLGDEEALRRQREEEAAKRAAERMQQAYLELQATDKARDMREQEMLRLQMQAAYKTGDVRKAQQIFERLMPDEEKKAKGIIK